MRKEQSFSNEVLGINHVAFTVDVDDFHRLVERIRNHHIPIIQESIQRGGGLSFQFEDPDGILLEFFTGSLKERMKNWQ